MEPDWRRDRFVTRIGAAPASATSEVIDEQELALPRSHGAGAAVGGRCGRRLAGARAAPAARSAGGDAARGATHPAVQQSRSANPDSPAGQSAPAALPDREYQAAGGLAWSWRRADRGAADRVDVAQELAAARLVRRRTPRSGRRATQARRSRSIR